nr:MAG TPA: hypothetical protein [Caudoviricetes sp.]
MSSICGTCVHGALQRVQIFQRVRNIGSSLLLRQQGRTEHKKIKP